MGEALRRSRLGLGPKTVNIDGDSLPDRICPCGNAFFTDALRLKEISGLLSPSGHPETMMLKVGFICVACGQLLPLRPEEPKKGSEIVLTGVEGN